MENSILSKEEIINAVDDLIGENTLRSSYFCCETKLYFRKWIGSNLKEVFIFIDNAGPSKMGGATSKEFQDEILKIVSNKEIAPSTGWYAARLSYLI